MSDGQRDETTDSADQARVSILVAVDLENAFRVFTEDIDKWWRRGLKYRVAGQRQDALILLEPRVGGRVLESFEVESGSTIIEAGRVTVWEPPNRLTFTWRAIKFTDDQATTVDVRFTPQTNGTLVVLTHSGWSSIPLDHPSRHQHGAAGSIRMTGLWWGELLSSFRRFAAKKSR